MGIVEYHYLCKVTGVWCFGAMGAPVEKEQVLDPILFNWKNGQAQTTDAFPAYKERLLLSNSPDSILVITGLYTREENDDYLANNPNSGYENLGLARAAEIRKLFPEIPDDRIRLESRRVNQPAKDPGAPYVASELKWMVKPDEGKAPSEDVEIVALPDRELIYFPYKSAERIKSDNLENYLVQLAAKVKSSGDKILLTGHTDNVGSAEYNMNLSLQRVSDVKALLVGLGVPATQIQTAGMGLKEPMASNTTEEGRAKNRRVEVELIKQQVQ